MKSPKGASVFSYADRDGRTASFKTGTGCGRYPVPASDDRSNARGVGSMKIAARADFYMGCTPHSQTTQSQYYYVVSLMMLTIQSTKLLDL
jgi:hypothetical protein